MSKEIGNHAEDQAAEYLNMQGYQILERNYFARVGEIDIVAKDDKTICFVEVKERAYGGYGGAISAITNQKLQKILKAARLYLYEHKLQEVNWRIDAVVIEGNNEPELLQNIYTEGM